MTKEELEKEAEKHADGVYHYKINVSDYGEDGIINYRYSDVKEAYQKGAEPREKRIAELEAEVKEWKDKADLWCKTANLKDHNIMINKELEKENAELKHTIATLRQEKDNVSMHAKAMEVVAKTRSDQLTKSKELLERFLNVGDLWELDGNAFLNLQSDVTQFIKDSEVEK